MSPVRYFKKPMVQFLWIPTYGFLFKLLLKIKYYLINITRLCAIVFLFFNCAYIYERYLFGL